MALTKITDLKGNEFKPYGTDATLDKLVDSAVFSDRYNAALQAYGLDKLVNDADWGIRAQVATNGYAIDVLENDEDEFVRAAVVRYLGRERRKSQREDNEKILKQYLTDESKIVRYALAEQGYGLDTLINDEDAYVRAGAANKASDEQLAILMKDEYPDVRIAVAKRGYGIDALINDDNSYVREMASKMKSEINVKNREVKAQS